MDKIGDCLSLLGKKVSDKVTGFTGIATSISFDLYGCIQVLIHPGIKDDNMLDSRWFDKNRIEILNHIPVMEQPDFVGKDIGPAEKPRFMKP